MLFTRLQDDYATIQVQSIPLMFGKRRFEYAWIGESNKTIVDSRVFRDANLPYPKTGNSFWLGHLELIVTDIDILSFQYEVALADGQGYQRFYNRRLYYFLDNLKCRFILTLYVWGLAHLEPNERVTWAALGRKK